MFLDKVRSMLLKPSKKDYRRKSVMPLLFLLLLLLSGVLMMWVIFNPVDGEEDDVSLIAFTSSGYEYSPLKGDFQSVLDEQLKEIDVIPNTERAYAPMASGAGFSFNTGVSKTSQELNLQVFNITAKYFNKDIVKNIPANSADPLIIMALGNVENATNTNTNELWTAAIPTKVMKDVKPSDLDTFGIQSTLTLSDFWKLPKWSKPNIQGPLQMNIYYGVDNAMIPSDLKGSETTRAGNLLQKLYPGYDYSKLISAEGKITGDRFNWPDAVNRTAGYMDHLYGRYLKNSSISKQGNSSIDNRYSVAALIGMAHNTGESVLVLGDTSRAGSWSPSIKSRQYANALGKPDILAVLSKHVDVNIKEYRDGKDLQVRAPQAAVNDVLSSIYSAGYLTTGYLDGVYKENREYPIHVLFSYLTLEKLYQGG